MVREVKRVFGGVPSLLGDPGLCVDEIVHDATSRLGLRSLMTSFPVTMRTS